MSAGIEEAHTLLGAMCTKIGFFWKVSWIDRIRPMLTLAAEVDNLLSGKKRPPGDYLTKLALALKRAGEVSLCIAERSGQVYFLIGAETKVRAPGSCVPGTR